MNSSPQKSSILMHTNSSMNSTRNYVQSNSSPFVTSSPNTNTKFSVPSKNMHKSIVSTGSDMSANGPLKPPKGPEKPLTPYMRFSKKYLPQVWEKVRASNPEAKLWDIGKTIGNMWRDLDEHVKQAYLDEYDSEKGEYEKLMKVYKHSPAYLAYEQMLQRSKNSPKVEKPIRPHIAPPVIVPAPHAEQNIVYIQHVDEDESEEMYSIGHVASARFQRNQRLMLDIFNSSGVPDLRTVVNIQRLTHARRQLRSLATHQRNSENELIQISADFQNKKRLMEESSQEFESKIKKVCEEGRQKLTEKNFEELVEKHENQIREYYAQYVKRQTGFRNEQNRQEVSILMQQLLAKVEESVNHHNLPNGVINGYPEHRNY